MNCQYCGCDCGCGCECKHGNYKLECEQCKTEQELAALREENERLKIFEGAYDLNQQEIHRVNLLNQELKAKLSRYESAVKVEGKVCSTGLLVNLHYLPKMWAGQRVTVLILPEEDV